MSTVRVSLNGGESWFEPSRAAELKRERGALADVLFDGPDCGGECDRCHNDGRSLWTVPGNGGFGWCHRCILSALSSLDAAIRAARS